MMALQKSLLEQSDIVPVLKSFDFISNDKEQLEVTNPPSFKIDDQVFCPEINNSTGSD